MLTEQHQAKIDAERAEGAACQLFLDSPAWRWMEAVLRKAHRRYQSEAARLGTSRSDTERCMLIALADFCGALLERPAEAVRNLARVHEQPTANGDQQRPPPFTME